MKSTLVCHACGNRTVIQRPRARKRPKGHVKTMWCWRCKGTRQHSEGPVNP
jgi:hypothetical protein